MTDEEVRAEIEELAHSWLVMSETAPFEARVESLTRLMIGIRSAARAEATKAADKIEDLSNLLRVAKDKAARQVCVEPGCGESAPPYCARHRGDWNSSTSPPTSPLGPCVKCGATSHGPCLCAPTSPPTEEPAPCRCLNPSVSQISDEWMLCTNCKMAWRMPETPPRAEPQKMLSCFWCGAYGTQHKDYCGRPRGITTADPTPGPTEAE